ncbi:glycosyltransferase family 2 protein [Sphingobacterium spiritivorum]|uniref:glycosyltransferase family 2 protein n=1 Tax=Sphingobacterium spiritivorum TaxID=258 RepID=UPI003DA3BDF5
MRYRYKVSVIMPCYNSGAYIKQAIQSLVDQSLEDWELIIIDDGSTDDSIVKVKSFNDKRIKLIQLEKNQGNYYARNVGIKVSSGKYIAMFDSDDVCHVNRLEIQYDHLQKKPKTGAIGSGFYFMDSDGITKAVQNRQCTASEFKINIINNNGMLQSTIFIRSHLIRKYKLMYNTLYTYASDYDFVFQCSKYFQIYNLADYCVFYRVHLNNITNSKGALQREYAFQIRWEILNYYFGKEFTVRELEFLNTIFHSQKHKIDLSYVESLFNRMLSFNKKKRLLNQTKFYQFLYAKFVMLVADK